MAEAQRASWDSTWASVARSVAQRSACDRAQVGAVLIKDNRVVSTGYNGPAAGHPADTSQGCRSWCLRAMTEKVSPEFSYGFGCPSIHAEANALLYASREDVVGATLYVTHAPCADCAKLISASGVARVIMLRTPEPHRPNPVPYLEMTGIEVLVY